MTDVGAGGCDSCSSVGALWWHPSTWPRVGAGLRQRLSSQGQPVMGLRQELWTAQVYPHRALASVCSPGTQRTKVRLGWFAEKPSRNYLLPFPQAPSQAKAHGVELGCSSTSVGFAI